MKNLTARLLVTPTLLLAIVGGCTNTRQAVDVSSQPVPLKLELGASGSPLGPIRIRSGQWITLPLCCPPVELRDANGKRLRKLVYTQEPQPLVARPALYSIVGHDPSGSECVLKIEVTRD